VELERRLKDRGMVLSQTGGKLYLYRHISVKQYIRSIRASIRLIQSYVYLTMARNEINGNGDDYELEIRSTGVYMRKRSLKL